MTAYYNEIDRYAAQWLRNLITAGAIAPGDVDERSIADVRAGELAEYDQCHFFAGIGGWSVALRLAGWPDDRPVWTGSCPCQPFSAAGAGKAGDDERHLWPAWFPLIAERRPPIVFGEQVEAAIGWGWLDLVFADLESEGYACGATVLPACGVGAPHIRQRLWFVADASHGRQDSDGTSRHARDDAQGRQDRPAGCDGLSRVLAHSDGRDASAEGLQRGGEHGQRAQDCGACRGRGWVLPNFSANFFLPCDACGGMGHTPINGSGALVGQPRSSARRQESAGGSSISGGALGDSLRTERRAPAEGRQDVEHGSGGGRQETPSGQRLARAVGHFWADAEWLPCTDGKSRPVGPGSFPLGHGIRNRPSKLRAYGNAIVPQVAAEFIKAFRECQP